ncbi:MAG: glycoside hydrolase family 3 protein, partial [Bryobacteraceae bacterium]
MNRREFTRTLTGAGALMAELQTAHGAEQASQSVANAPYKNAKLPIPQRVEDLLSRMTLEEKVEQISGGFHYGGVIDPTGKYNDQNYRDALRKIRGTTTQIVPAHDRAVLRNAIQRYQIEKTRLGIPALSIGEGLHGFMENGSTSFPQAIGLASTWDPDLIHQVFTAVAHEASAVGVKQLFAPVVHIGREPRWGRVGESLGEDPYLISRMGVAAVSAFQGGKAFPVSKHHTLATLKHFVGYGQPEGGRNDAPRNCAERVLREAFFPAYKACVEEGHVASIMAAYNEIQGGVPCHINRWLLTRVLREEWGFDGYVTSDGGALEMLVNFHHIAEDNAGAARMALAAGVDFDLSNGAVYKTLVDEVKAGRVAEKQVDGAAG